MKHVLVVLIFVCSFTSSFAQAEIDSDSLKPFSTSELRTKLFELRAKAVVMCPLGILGGVVTIGVQVVPLLSTVNALVGRSEDWRSADWALQESLYGLDTDELYAATIGGILAPVYDTVSGAVVTVNHLAHAKLENGFRYGSSKASLRIIRAQESRMIGSRSSCVHALSDVRILRKEIVRRRAAR